MLISASIGHQGTNPASPTQLLRYSVCNIIKQVKLQSINVKIKIIKHLRWPLKACLNKRNSRTVFRHSSKDQSLTPQTQNPLMISCTANVQSKWARILKTKARLHFTELEDEEAAEVKNSMLPNRGGFKCRLTVGVGCLPHTSDGEKCIFAVDISKVSPSLLKQEQVAAAELPLSQLLTLWQQSPSPHDCL